MLYEGILRPLLFTLSPEKAQKVGKELLKIWPFEKNLPQIPTTLVGIELKNPVGLAAGFDKDGEYIDALARLGFGYLVLGTVTKQSYTGHKEKYYKRDKKILYNSLGLPNKGVWNLVQNIKKRKSTVPLIASIAGQSDEEIYLARRVIEPYVDGIELNLSCPTLLNTRLHVDELRFVETIKMLKMSSEKPLFLKVGFDWFLSHIFEAIEAGIDGVTISNSAPVVRDKRMVGQSGWTLMYNTLTTIKQVRYSYPDIPINASGGITNSDYAKSVLNGGADTVQLYTGLVIEGPRLIEDIIREMKNEK